MQHKTQEKYVKRSCNNFSLLYLYVLSLFIPFYSLLSVCYDPGPPEERVPGLLGTLEAQFAEFLAEEGGAKAPLPGEPVLQGTGPKPKLGLDSRARAQIPLQGLQFGPD